MPALAGRYINLERSADRRAAMEQRLTAAGAADRYLRVAAVDGAGADLARSTLSPGEMGCLLSHRACLVEAAGRDGPTHILEDDAVFTPEGLAIVRQIAGEAGARWDMLFTDIVVPAHVNTLVTLAGLWRATGMDAKAEPRVPETVHYMELRDVPFAGSASYVVSPQGAARLVALIDAELARGATMQIDMLFRFHTARGEVSAGCAVPFLTSVDPADLAATTIAERRQHQGSQLALFILRYFFFHARSDAALRAMGARLGPPAGTDGLDLLWPAIRYVLGEDYVSF